MTRSNPRLGILLMILAVIVFSIQDALSRHLASHYNVMMVVLLRFWFFALFVVALAASRPGGVRRVARSGQQLVQIGRGMLLVLQICVVVLSFVRLGLIETHAIFAVYPLLVSALAGPLLGEYVGWRRRLAIIVGLVGVLIILRPGVRVFSPEAIIPLIASLMFAGYALMTRLAARTDSAETSLFYTGVAGAATITLIAPFWWEPMQGWADWSMMFALCLTGVLGHFLLIRSYEVAETSVVQPFAYFQLLFIAAIALAVFGERPDVWTIAGGALILAAGLYTIVRTGRVGRIEPDASDPKGV